MSENIPEGGSADARFLDRVPLATGASVREEWASTVTHAAAVVGAVAASVELIRLSMTGGSLVSTISLVVFGLTLVNLYAVSTVYHLVGNVRVKRLFRILDHISVLYLIAGSYTVVAMLFLHGPIHWIILFLEWGLALIGTLYKVLFLGRARGLSLVFYLVMGWLALIAWPQMISLQQAHLVFWLLGGGAAYMIGLAFFGLKRLPYNHAVWHLFAMAGSTCHVVGIYLAVRGLFG